jgi:hypothetical protein
MSRRIARLGRCDEGNSNINGGLEGGLCMADSNKFASCANPFTMYL